MSPARRPYQARRPLSLGLARAAQAQAQAPLHDGAQRFQCVDGPGESAAEPSPPSSPRPPEPPWPKPAYGLRPDGYCTDQDCGQLCCLTGCGVAPGATHHVLYMHTEKTGGASIECATQAWQAAGWWTNMGHTTQPQVEACEDRCARSIRVARVLTVRDPYAYWQSVYRFAWHGQGEWLSSWLSWHTLEWTLHQQRTGILQSFPHFMEWVEGETELLGDAHGLSQSSRVFSACGDPCEYDVLLRTENLSAGWRELVQTYHLPKMALPHLNGALNVTFNDDPPAPTVDLVPDVVGIINLIDAPIFDRLGTRGGRRPLWRASRCARPTWAPCAPGSSPRRPCSAAACWCCAAAC